MASTSPTATPKDPISIKAQAQGLLQLYDVAHFMLTGCKRPVQLLELDEILLDTLVRRPGPHPRRSELLVSMAKASMAKFRPTDLGALSDGFLLRLDTLDRWRDSGVGTPEAGDRRQPQPDGDRRNPVLQTQVTGLDVANINKTVLSYLDSATLRRGDAAGIIEVVEESELDDCDRRDKGADEAVVKPRDISVTSTTPNSNIPAVIAEPKPVYTRSSPSTPTDRIIESEVVQIDEVVPSHNDSLPIHDDAAGIIDVIYEFELDDGDWEDEDINETGAPSQEPHDVRNRGQVPGRTVSNPPNPNPLPKNRLANKTRRERWWIRVLRFTKTAKVGRKGFRGTTKKTRARKRQRRVIKRRVKRFKGLAKWHKRSSKKAIFQ